jgi:hypothetical protein
MTSPERVSAPLPWLAGAVVLLYLTLLIMRFALPPAKMSVEVIVHPPAPAVPN